MSVIPGAHGEWLARTFVTETPMNVNTCKCEVAHLIIVADVGPDGNVILAVEWQWLLHVFSNRELSHLKHHVKDSTVRCKSFKLLCRGPSNASACTRDCFKYSMGTVLSATAALERSLLSSTL